MQYEIIQLSSFLQELKSTSCKSGGISGCLENYVVYHNKQQNKENIIAPYDIG